MLISFVVPAYNASQTISRSLNSVFNQSLPDQWTVEVIVVDDGSQDSIELAKVVAQFSHIRLVVHEKNRGMCAGRNTGINASSGEIVIILDADDEMVSNWPITLQDILEEWPVEINVCYAACRNTKGQITASEPTYNGFLTLEDVLNERHSGEYLPMFRGDYIRNKNYLDLKMRKSCGVVSYINFALDGPFYISNRVLRTYHDAQMGSVSSMWYSPKKSVETSCCYDELLRRYGDLYKKYAPRMYQSKLLRLAIYQRFGGKAGALNNWRQGISFHLWKESLGVTVVLIAGPTFGSWIVRFTKKIGLIRKYG
ncbi:MAG: glycosyltransferase family 2 protein [Pseudomonadota bacterium]